MLLTWDGPGEMDYFIPFDPEDKKTRLKNGFERHDWCVGA